MDVESSSQASYVVAQLGARMHYAVPRIMYTTGVLERLYTDTCAVKGWPRFLLSLPRRLMPQALRRLADRTPKDLPRNKITAFSGFGLDYARRLSGARTPADKIQTHLWAGRTFCTRILDEDWCGATGVYAFNSAALELLEHARRRGAAAVMEQTIAPREVERRLLARERERFPQWQASDGDDRYLDEFCARERAEWTTASLIVCGSEFVRQGIAACGGPVERCAVVPYGVDCSFSLPPRHLHAGPLRVLTVGAVGLRKGSPYVLEASKRFAGRAVFRVVGPLVVPREPEAQLRRHLDLIGAVPRSRVLEHYAWADVFLLPSICEGSATAAYEAMAAALPVICTPNTGSVVRNGTDGFVVGAGDVETMCQQLEQFVSLPGLSREMGLNARERASSFGLESYAARLLRLLVPDYRPSAELALHLADIKGDEFDHGREAPPAV